MTEQAIEIIKTAISMAQDAGTAEIEDVLNPLLDILQRRKCREGLVENGMTGYCNGCCKDFAVCSKENGFGNWFSGTGMQPRRAVGVDFANKPDVTTTCKICRHGDALTISDIQEQTSNKQVR